MSDMDQGYLEIDAYDRTKVQIFRTREPNTKAKLAIEFTTRWGMVAGRPDGEDSAGRQQHALLTPEEVVDRAMMVADLLVDRIADRGWFLELPSPKLLSKERK